VVLAYTCEAADRRDCFITLLPAGLPVLAAVLAEQGQQVVLANYCQHTIAAAAKDIAARQPVLVGMSLLTHNRHATLALARALKRLRPETIIAAGGPHAAALAGQLLARCPELDYIVRGEGEAALPALLAAVAGGQRPARGIIDATRLCDLDRLPLAASFAGTMIGIDAPRQFGVLIGSRGCPEQCSYCCSPGFWHRQVRYRSPESLIAELRVIHTRFGLRAFSLRDDNFLLERKRATHFAELLRRIKPRWRWSCQARVDCVDTALLRELRAAGLEHIQFGLETAAPRLLAAYRKRLTPDAVRAAAAAAHAARLPFTLYLMTGAPGEETADIDATAALLRELRPDGIVVSPVAYYPGTALYDAARRAGRISDDDWFTRRGSGIVVRNDRIARSWPARLAAAIQR
ncbi:MAG TPA: radical SAM protein, partial [bacterium]|nr:radical SAM protein [bacterium]